MHDLIGFLRRVVVVCAIVLGTGAMSCTVIVDGIRFAPGYGYVIEVEHGPKGDNTYFVFETHEAAEKWAFNFQQTPNKSAAMGAPGYKMRVDEDDRAEVELFDKIWTALRTPSTPPGLPEVRRTIDQVVPTIPTAPVPQ